MSGWIKIHRGMLDNPAVCKDADHLAIWIHLLLNATHKPLDILIGSKRITLQPGELATSRKALSAKYRLSESKVERILNLFKIEQQIEQQSFSTNRVISVLNWHKYQESEQQNEQQSDSDRTASEQQSDTNKKERIKELKNERSKDIKDIVLFLNDSTGKKFSEKTDGTIKAINARLDQGYTIEDFKQVIKVKTSEWIHDPKMVKYLCPDTLFRPGNFEKYLNQDMGGGVSAGNRRSAEKPNTGIDFGF